MQTRYHWLWIVIPFVLVTGIFEWTISNGWGLLKMQHDFGFYNLLTDGFQHHQLSLWMRPPAQLLQLKDPYDPVQDLALNVHDVSLYKGRYYLYWGPAPALILFWPARYLPLIPYMPESWGAMIFCAVGLLANVVFLMQLVRFLKLEVPEWMLSVAVLNLGLGSPAIFVLRHVGIWHTAIAGAYMCLMLSLSFLAFGILDEHRRPWALGVGSLFLGLAVGSRAVAIAYLPALAIASIILIQKTRKSMDIRLRSGLLCLLWAPCLVIIGVYGIYNRLRFDSFTEFGFRYVLGGYRATNISQFALNNLWIGFRQYFLQHPYWFSGFPYLQGGHLAFGLPYMCPMIALLLVTPWLNRASKFTVGCLVFLGFLGAVVLSWASSEPHYRFELDFAPVLLVAATLAWFAYRERSSAQPYVRIAWTSLGVLLIAVGCFMNIALSITGQDDWFYRQNPAAFQRLQRLCDSLESRLGFHVTPSQPSDRLP